MSDQEMRNDDPLRQRVAGNVRFKDDDPDDVKQLLIAEAVRCDQQFWSSSYKHRPSEKR